MLNMRSEQGDLMPKPVPAQDPTPLFARQVLELYEDALREVRFPDLDLALLRAARDDLQTTQLQVDGIEADLQRARAALDAQAAALNALAERALAYARVFTSGDAVLHARVAEVGRKRAVPLAEGTQPKRRGRPPKTETASDLFGTDHALSAAAADGGEPTSLESAPLGH
jgi:hypothetical protein